MGKEKKTLNENEEICGGKAHTNTWKGIRNILTITDGFLNQKGLNVCGHTWLGSLVCRLVVQVALYF